VQRRRRRGRHSAVIARALNHRGADGNVTNLIAPPVSQRDK